ncbi:MAG: hypothetical protein ISP90_08305 [Nevskia sp.]|nr:hypothetical protein [Nevskia sp.]
MCRRLATPDVPRPEHETLPDLRPRSAGVKAATPAFDEAERPILIRDLPMDQAILFWSLLDL